MIYCRTFPAELARFLLKALRRLFILELITCSATSTNRRTFYDVFCLNSLSLCPHIFIFFPLRRSPHSEEDYNDFWHVLRMVGFILSFANSCTNPVALYCVSGAFRKHFNR